MVSTKKNKEQSNIRAVLWLGLLSNIVFAESSAGQPTIGNRIFTRKLHYALYPNIVEQHFMLRSQIECASVCTSNSSCNSAAWEYSDKRCRLSSADTTSFGYRNDNLTIMLDSIVMSKVIFNVTIYEGSEGVYSFTYAQAVSYCVQMGSVIASPADLLQARSDGYQYCRCGWLSNERNGFVMLYHALSCSGYFTTDIHYCEGVLKADVYCIVV